MSEDHETTYDPVPYRPARAPEYLESLLPPQPGVQIPRAPLQSVQELRAVAPRRRLPEPGIAFAD